MVVSNEWVVVIYFQTYIFVILNTVYPLFVVLPCRCDLLSNLYLCHIEYSTALIDGADIAVVICFQTYIFVILNTVSEIDNTLSYRCDLLSNLYLCHIEYSIEPCLACSLAVVICFQTYIFVILNTVLLDQLETLRLL